MYTNDFIKQNTVGRECVCCKEFYPIKSVDEFGHEIFYPNNSLHMCPYCHSVLMELVNKEVERKKANMPTIRV